MRAGVVLGMSETVGSKTAFLLYNLATLYELRVVTALFHIVNWLLTKASEFGWQAIVVVFTVAFTAVVVV